MTLSETLTSLTLQLDGPGPSFFGGPRAVNWQELAQSPKKFNDKLNAVLGDVRKCMLAIYEVGTARGRPKAHAERDAKIYELREAQKSFGYIAKTLKMNGKAVNRAYSREQERRKAGREDIKTKVLLLKTLLKSARQPE